MASTRYDPSWQAHDAIPGPGLCAAPDPSLVDPGSQPGCLATMAPGLTIPAWLGSIPSLVSTRQTRPSAQPWFYICCKAGTAFPSFVRNVTEIVTSLQHRKRKKTGSLERPHLCMYSTNPHRTSDSTIARDDTFLLVSGSTGLMGYVASFG